jgi:hypothetical protein
VDAPPGAFLSTVWKQMWHLCSPLLAQNRAQGYWLAGVERRELLLSSSTFHISTTHLPGCWGQGQCCTAWGVCLGVLYHVPVHAEGCCLYLCAHPLSPRGDRRPMWVSSSCCPMSLGVPFCECLKWLCQDLSQLYPSSVLGQRLLESHFMLTEKFLLNSGLWVQSLCAGPRLPHMLCTLWPAAGPWSCKKVGLESSLGGIPLLTKAWGSWAVRPQHTGVCAICTKRGGSLVPPGTQIGLAGAVPIRLAPVFPRTFFRHYA